MEQKGTLKYRKLQRTPQSGENAGKKKWYATAVTDREVDFEGFVSHISDLGLFSIGMTSKAEDTKEKVTAASVEGVHLIVRNTKSWSNSELRKKCKIQEYGGYTGTDEGGTSGGTSGGTEQGGGTQPGGSQEGGDGLE